MTEEQVDTVEKLMIPDEDGNEEEFEVLMEFEVDEDGRQYILVMPTEEKEGDDEGEVYAFRYEEQDEEMTLFPIDDEEEWKMVEEMFNTMISEEEEDEETI